MKQVDIALFCAILKGELPLQVAPTVRVSKQIKFEGDKCFGLYEGENFGKFEHKIRVSRKECKGPVDLFATLAHEFIHAWQLENDYEVDHSRKAQFKAWKKFFSSAYGVDIVSMV